MLVGRVCTACRAELHVAERLDAGGSPVTAANCDVMLLAANLCTAASSAAGVAMPPVVPVMDLVDQSAAAGRLLKSAEYPSGPTEAAWESM